MTRTRRWTVSSGSVFEERIGYSRALVDGERVYVSGTTGFDYATMTIHDDVVEQTEQCLRNITEALAGTGCTVLDVVRVRYMLPVREDFEACWPALRRVFGEVRPAGTMAVCGLADERMRIEIEVDARRARLTPGDGRGLRIEAVGGDGPGAGAGGEGAPPEDWRAVRDAVAPAAAPAAAGPAGRDARDLRATAYLGGLAVGCSTVRPPADGGSTATATVGVLPAFRGRGIGTALFEAALAQARERGAGTVRTEVPAADGDGLRFARGCGFVERKRYVPDGGSDEWIELWLAPRAS
ncbi:GNAT family N-acetyltransferase [Streptomyces sp. SHP 1-2]|uniref:GNAT family N-acetyltransferase n=1 Tax=Streptomyces sp. SHP 1-2 TaxID=2769489 RepID=UPI002238819D|nr:GNAT family N-acetyltransferase [Streptomyces sp. SHP 1-2]MCW5250857.1 GNAT family N-acetyltransferase [Streptomyces sp. SHP 1-2]